MELIIYWVNAVCEVWSPVLRMNNVNFPTGTDGVTPLYCRSNIYGQVSIVMIYILASDLLIEMT